jgi:hypothetical protein
MAFVLSCETIGLIRVLGIVYRFFSADIVYLYVLPRASAVSIQGQMLTKSTTLLKT